MKYLKALTHNFGTKTAVDKSHVESNHLQGIYLGKKKIGCVCFSRETSAYLTNFMNVLFVMILYSWNFISERSVLNKFDEISHCSPCGKLRKSST